MKKALLILLGCAGVVLGAIGAVVPLIPAFPFLLLAFCCFARSSQRLHNWFIHTRLYRDHLEGMISKKGLTRKAKLRIMLLVTLLMSIGFVMMNQVPVGQFILALVWLFHILYFLFGLRTLPQPDSKNA